MNAIILNATLKPSPEPSNTEALAGVVARGLEARGATCRHVRLVDHDIKPGVTSEAVGEGNDWPSVRAHRCRRHPHHGHPTWLGQPSSVCKRALERMDAFLSETSDDGTPSAYNKAAGMVITGNEDGAHACIANIAQALIDIGYTVPGQGWTYWNKGPGPGEEEYSNSDDTEWSDSTGEAAAHNIAAVARALAANPIGNPPNA